MRPCIQRFAAFGGVPTRSYSIDSPACARRRIGRRKLPTSEARISGGVRP